MWSRLEHISICAWYRSEYDSETGERIRYLTDAEYALVLSHGCCPECWQRMLTEDTMAKIEINVMADM